VSAKSTVYGERKRRPVVAVTGLLLLGVSAALIYRAARDVEWYRYYPTGFVLSDLGSSDPTRAKRAVGEIERRWGTETLDDDDFARIFEIGLAEYTSDKRSPERYMILTFLGRMFTESLLTETQQATLFETMTEPSRFAVRPRVLQGYPVPVVLEYRRPPIPGLVLRPSSPLISVDGVMTSYKSLDDSRYSIFPNMLTVQRYGVDGENVGRHELSADVEARIFDSRIDTPSDVSDSDSDVFERPTVFERQVRLESPFEIIPADGPSDVTLLQAPMSAVRVRTRSNILGTRNGERHCLFEVFVTSELNTAFRVFKRIENKEWEIGTFASRSPDGRFPKSLLTKVGESRCDLVLRSDPDVARRTVDIFEIWEGELIDEGVLDSETELTPEADD
jgi:hypothetical protein